MKPYHILVIRCKGTSKRRRDRAKSENPQSRVRTPFVCLRVRRGGKAVDEALVGNFSSWKRSNHFVEVLRNESCIAQSKIEAYAIQESICSDLRERGWKVQFNNPTNRCVYIVELRDSVWSNRKFREDNKELAEIATRQVYVGETVRTPEERFEIHKSKTDDARYDLSSPIVHSHGIGLAKDLMEKFSSSNLTMAESLKLEHDITLKLRELGIAAYSR